MSSTRAGVAAAVQALVAAAWPAAEVKGLDNAAPWPERVPANGLAIVREGDPGQPEVDLSPLTYHWEHAFPVEMAALAGGGRSAGDNLDLALAAIGAAVAANRTLGGLCAWLDVTEPAIEDVAAAGTAPAKGCELIILASYSTTTPLN